MQKGIWFTAGNIRYKSMMIPSLLTDCCCWNYDLLICYIYSRWSQWWWWWCLRRAKVVQMHHNQGDGCERNFAMLRWQAGITQWPDHWHYFDQDPTTKSTGITLTEITDITPHAAHHSYKLLTHPSQSAPPAPPQPPPPPPAPILETPFFCCARNVLTDKKIAVEMLST